MPDERRAQPTSPYLRTRPATMLTAIGLCLIIVLIQIVPELQDATSGFSPPPTSIAR